MLYYITILTLVLFTTVSSEEDPIYVGKCPSEGQNNSTESSNCPRYCMFWKGQLIDEIVCPPKFHYSPENETCISSGENGCSETGDYSKKVSYGSCNGQCPTSDDAEDIYYLSHDNCHMYCICVLGQPIEMKCDNDKNFSTLDNKCIHPLEADMKCPDIREEIVQEETVEEITDYKDCLGQCLQQNATGNSSNTENIEIFAHKIPTKFCICTNGFFQVYDCLENQVFVEENKSCRNPQDSQKLRSHSSRIKIRTNEVKKPQVLKNDDERNEKRCSEEDKITTHIKTTETNTTETKVLTEEEKKSLGNEEINIETVITKKIKRTNDEVITTIFNTTTTTVVTVTTSVTPLVKEDQNGGSDKDSTAQCWRLIEQLLQKKVI